MSAKNDLLVIAGVALALIAAAYYAKKKLADAGAAVGEIMGDAWIAAATGATAAGNIASLPVYAVGDAIGVPRTNMTECERAKAEGRTWDASFSCDAVDWLKYISS